MAWRKAAGLIDTTTLTGLVGLQQKGMLTTMSWHVHVCTTFCQHMYDCIQYIPAYVSSSHSVLMHTHMRSTLTLTQAPPITAMLFLIPLINAIPYFTAHHRQSAASLSHNSWPTNHTTAIHASLTLTLPFWKRTESA